MRYFNTAGPCNIEEHYMIDASARLQGVEQLIDRKQYFLIHAARQSGKTTYLKDLTNRLNAANKYYTLYCSLEGMQNIVDPREGIPEIVMKIQNLIQYSHIPCKEKFAKDVDYANFTDVLNKSLTLFCMLLDKPFVILFDEADCLSDDTLISFLRQLRDGYNGRPERAFPHSVALVGMRNIRDYKARVRPEDQTLGSASPFNIVTKTYTLQNFTQKEIAFLYQQHVDETGQLFEEDVVQLVWEQTQGQPWLVNYIANEAIVEILKSDYTKPVTTELVNKAIQNVMLNRPAHIDSLLERLKEDRIRKIIEPIILGEDLGNAVESDDFQYTKDLGLIREDNFLIKPANPIYAEVIIRKLSSSAQKSLQNPEYPYQMPRYLKNGRIDVGYLLKDFQQFWRENSEIWIKQLDYPEAAPHLVLMGFLQRVINGGGEVIREYAAGTGRLDLCMIYENQKYPIELKIRYEKKYIEKGIKKLAGYMDTLGCNEGWMVVFDRRKTIKWKSKIYTKKEKVDGKIITIVGA